MRSVTLILTLVFAATQTGPLSGQDRLDRARALDDLRYVIALLEETHPDPYSAFGGEVEFKRRVQELLDRVPENGLTTAELYDLLRPVFGELRDGHTYISSPPTSEPRDPLRYLPVRFDVATDALFVQSATPEYADLIGYRLKSVRGESLDMAAARAAMVRPAENGYAARRWLIRYLRSNRGAQRLYDGIVGGLSVQFVGLDGEQVERTLPYELGREDYFGGEWSAASWDAIDPVVGPFAWQFIGDSDVAYMRVSSIVGREAFEELRAVGRQDLRDQLSNYYGRYGRAPMPEALDEAIEGVPCFTAAVNEVLTAMRDRESRYLLLDLRGNGGGWSALSTPLLLLTYGDRYYNYDYPVTFVTRISPAYLELNDMTLAELNEQLGTDYHLGDYHFKEEESLASRVTRDDYAAELEVFGCGLADHFQQIQGPVTEPPNVLVLVDPATFSAAYHFMYRLWHLGARIVGVPSSQAGNAFVDVTPYQLPHSSLTGSIARTAQILFPEDERRGRVLFPDFPMTWQRFVDYGFDEHATVRYAVDLIVNGLGH